MVVIAPRPTDCREEPRLATGRLHPHRELRKAPTFAVAARRFSADPGSRDRGGELGWARRGLFVPEFDRVAFALKIGVISEPVRGTPFGYHLIQVMRTAARRIQVRHILIAAEVTATDVDSAEVHAHRCTRRRRRARRSTPSSAQWHDGTEEREAAAVPLDKLPEVYKRASSAGTPRRRCWHPSARVAGVGGRSSPS
jgi:hypothetical protein